MGWQYGLEVVSCEILVAGYRSCSFLKISFLYETTQCRNSKPQNIECRRNETLQALPSATTRQVVKSFIEQTEYIHSTFDVRCSMFDVGRSSVSFSIKLVASAAGGGAEPLR